MNHDFSGKIAVVTGAAQGIGFAAAEKLAAGGAHVIILDMNEDAIDVAVKKLLEHGYQASGHFCNIADRASVEAAMAYIMNTFGRLDILVNNAGITRDRMLHKMSYEEWDKVIEVNLTGAFNVLHCVLPFMRKQNSGAIVSVSSTAFFGSVGQCNYSASKAGIIGLTHSLAKESAKCNIRVNAVLPGGTQTDILKTVPQEVLDSWNEAIPMHRLGRPEDQANAIAFLCSDEASYITGQCLVVDGGLNMCL